MKILAVFEITIVSVYVIHLLYYGTFTVEVCHPQYTDLDVNELHDNH